MFFFLTLADRCHSRPLLIGLADSGRAAHQDEGRVTAVGGHGAKEGSLAEADVSVLGRLEEAAVGS